MKAQRHTITQLSPEVLLYKITAGKKKNHLFQEGKQSKRGNEIETVGVVR